MWLFERCSWKLWSPLMTNWIGKSNFSAIWHHSTLELSKAEKPLENWDPFLSLHIKRLKNLVNNQHLWNFQSLILCSIDALEVKMLQKGKTLKKYRSIIYFASFDTFRQKSVRFLLQNLSLKFYFALNRQRAILQKN